MILPMCKISKLTQNSDLTEFCSDDISQFPYRTAEIWFSRNLVQLNIILTVTQPNSVIAEKNTPKLSKIRQNLNFGSVSTFRTWNMYESYQYCVLIGYVFNLNGQILYIDRKKREFSLFFFKLSQGSSTHSDIPFAHSKSGPCDRYFIQILPGNLCQLSKNHMNDIFHVSPYHRRLRALYF